MNALDGDEALGQGADAAGYHPENVPHVIEDGQGDKGLLCAQPVGGGIQQGVGSEGQEGHQENGAVPQEDLEGLQHEEVLHGVQLLLPQARDGLLEGALPHLELDDLEVIQHLDNLLQPFVLLVQLGFLEGGHSEGDGDADQEDDAETNQSWKKEREEEKRELKAYLDH